MEKKLAEYRAKKIKEKSDVLEQFVTKEFLETSTTKDLNEKIDDESDNDSVSEFAVAQSSLIKVIFFKLYNVKSILNFAIWFCLLIFFIKLEFAAVYLAVSGLVVMYYSMDKRKKTKKEPSAYSVFNKNCERIDGTFTAEQFEKQMIYGGAVR
ncbi:uncharacterized protein LOC105843889 [Hydra vulgaris]|uniref:uncharacterized protein LOC105843889 n=1 Tax=Hydra vulgaris TaxID=6087 RepID=UPI000192779A|nr:uncharacterized protein LOC105843889 [Hydra vulgaris]